MVVFFEWLIEWLLGRVEKKSVKRRSSLLEKRGRALSVFDDIKVSLDTAKQELVTEAGDCQQRVQKKQAEIEAEKKAAADLEAEEARINEAMKRIDSLLGLQNETKSCAD